MTIFALLAMLATLSPVQSSGAAVQPPRFEGQWTLDPKFYSPSEALDPICERTCVITQDAAMLTVKVRDKVTEYKLNGVPSVQKLKVAEYAPEITRTARWEGQTLLVIMLVTVEDSKVETRSKISLQGGRLVIEVSGSSRRNQRYEFTQTK